MQNIIDLILELQKIGVKIQLDEDKIKVIAPDGRMTQEMINKISENKGALIDFLKKNQENPQDIEPIVHDEENRYQPFSLTDVQQAYWVGRSNEFELGNVATHMYMEFEENNLDTSKLEIAWNHLIQRHDMLRAVVNSNGMQQVLKDVSFYEIKIVDFDDQDDVVELGLLALRDQMSHQVLTADCWPLFDIRVSKLKNHNYRIHMSIDLLIADALSWQILFKELITLYTVPECKLEPIDVTFRDFVYAENKLKKTKIYEESLNYWRDYIKNLPGAPDLPLAKDPALIEQPHFVRRQEALNEDIWGNIQKYALKTGFTASAVLMQVYSMVLAHWSRSPHFCINLTLFNRLPLHKNIDQVIGDFTSLTLLEFNNNYTDSFYKLTDKVQKRLWKNLDHRYVSGVQVIREINQMNGGMHSPLMPVVFTSDLAHVSSEMLKEVYGVSQTPQVWIDHQVIEQNGKLVLNWDCVDEIFPEGMIDEMFFCYVDLLKRLGEEKNLWQCSMKELIQNKKKLDQHLEEQNSVDQNFESDLLHQYFIKSVEKYPHQVALHAENMILTYHELAQRSAQIGWYLRAHNKKPLVAVVMNKGWEQIVAVLGILQAGFAYIPISAELPRERISYLLKNSDVDLILTQSKAGNLEVAEGLGLLFVDDTNSYASYPKKQHPIYQKQDDLAYIIYTSGSTGQPKGVQISHKSAANTLIDINKRFHVSKDDKIMGISELSFDLSVYDIFGTFAAGATLVLPSVDNRKDPEQWIRLIEEVKVTVWNSVPALMEMLVQYVQGQEIKFPSSIRLILLSGDWISVRLATGIQNMSPATEIISLGGATEAAIWSNYYKIESITNENKSIPYGKALKNQTMYIMDNGLRLRETWVPGGIYIGGIGLARGYVNDEELTTQKFIIHPKTGERLYATGDMGRYLPDGNIEFLGREDCQVKINGHRIELGEIEYRIDQHPLVTNSVVNICESEGRKKIIAYIVQTKGSAFEQATTQAIIQDPVERLKFKLAHKNHREINGEYISLNDIEPVDMDPYLERRSYRSFSQKKIKQRDFILLFQNFRQQKLDQLPILKSLYASAGSLYPVQLYIYIKDNRVEGIPGGSYYYHPQENVFYVLEKDSQISSKSFPMGNSEIFEQSAFAIFLVGDKSAIEPMYGSWSKEFMYIEAGLISQLFEMKGPEVNIGFCQIGNYEFDRIKHWFRIQDGYQYLHCLVGGHLEKEQLLLEGLLKDSQDLLQLSNEVGHDEINNDYDATVIEIPDISWHSEEHEVDPPISEDIQNYIEKYLPDYMMPSHFINILSIPLSPNGKVDRKLLPSPMSLMKQTKGVEPQTELEIKLAKIWCDILEKDKVGINDSLFELGGNSVDVIKIYNEMNRLLQNEEGVAVFKIKDFFHYPTIKAICDHIEKESENANQNINIIDRDLKKEYKISVIECEEPKSKVEVIFLTGATGYLGAHILQDLLNSTDCRVICLVRPKSEVRLENRIQNKMIELKIWDESFADRIEIFAGDMEMDKLGNVELFENLAQQADNIIHCASWVNFVYPYDALRNVNVRGLDNIIELAASFRIKPIHFISSLTALPMAGENYGVIDEEFRFDNYDQLLNGYSQSKWVAERILEKVRKYHVPVNIYRPAFIYGNSITGTCNEKDLIWAVIKSIIQFKSFTDLGEVQAITVNYVSQMVVKAVLDSGSWNKNYNLILQSPIRFLDIFYMLKQMGYEMEQEYPRVWIERVRNLEPDNALSHFLPFLENLSDDSENERIGAVEYSDLNSKELRELYHLNQEGLTSSVLNAAVNHLIETGFLEKIPVQSSQIIDSKDYDQNAYYDSENYSLWNPFSDMEDLIKYRKFGPSLIVRAEGPYIYNAKGQKFINAASSLWNVAVGHGREEIVMAAEKQMRELAYSSCFRQTHPRAMELADKLVELTEGYYTHVYLGTNGSEAIETAFKMTRQYFRQSEDENERRRYKILSLKGSYHGVTLGAISTSGDENDNEKYGPLLSGFEQINPPYCYRCPYEQKGSSYCQYECTQALEDLIKKEDPDTCAAFILEPIMGVYGLMAPPRDYYAKIGEICRKYNLLLIADEVTTGFGRTGKLFHSIDWPYRPDILVLGKGISSGYLPLSATLATENIYRRFLGKGKSFSHGSTASGHPVCASVGLSNIEIFRREKLVERSAEVGGYLLKQLEELKEKHKVIGDVRGQGLMIGIELVKDQQTKEPLPQKDVFRILMDCYSMGLYIYLAPNLYVLGLYPPLIIDKSMADEIVRILDTSMSKGIKSAAERTGRFIKSNLLNKKNKE